MKMVVLKGFEVSGCLVGCWEAGMMLVSGFAVFYKVVVGCVDVFTRFERSLAFHQ